MTRKRYLPYVLVVCVTLAALHAIGCSSEEPKSNQNASAPANEHCPIMGGEIDPELKTTWNGKTVAFCCEPCLPKWEKLSEVDKARRLADPPKKK